MFSFIVVFFIISVFNCFLSYRDIVVLFCPGVDGGGDAAAFTFRLGDDEGLVDGDLVVGLLELVGDVLGDGMLVASGVLDDDVQVALALARQLAEGVEGGGEPARGAVHLHGEVDGGGLGALLAKPEEGAAGLVGDEGVDAGYVFRSRDVGQLEAVGLHDGGCRCRDGDDALLSAEGRYLHLLLRHQQVVGGVDDGPWCLVFAAACERCQLGLLYPGDVAGEGLEGADAALAPYLCPLRAEGVDHHVVGAWCLVHRAAVTAHELGVHQCPCLSVVEAHLHVFRHLYLGVRLLADLQVDFQFEFQAECQLQVGVLSVVVVVAQVLVFAGGESEG